MSMELPGARELAPSDLTEFNVQPTAAPEDLAFTPDQVLGPRLPG